MKAQFFYEDRNISSYIFVERRFDEFWGKALVDFRYGKEFWGRVCF